MEKRWFDPSQPQTLQSAVILSYLNAAFTVFAALAFGRTGFLYLFLASLAEGVAGFGIANEKKWGYILDIVAVSISLLVYAWILSLGIVSLSLLFSILFAVALLVALLHPRSREYGKIWFR